MVNGVRSSRKSGSGAILYQPAAILELQVYHNDLKAMNRIKESSWAVLYNEVLSDVVKNTIALYMVELLYKSLKQPEQNNDLFYFCEESFTQLDGAEKNKAANFPLFFALHLFHFFGFRINAGLPPQSSGNNLYLDLVEGNFINEQPLHPHFLEGENALLTAELLNIKHPDELDQVKLNGMRRRELLWKYNDYYSLHIQDFGTMRTLPVLQEVLG
jgi:DNA repair protein RecO (recombination protein O)